MSVLPDGRVLISGGTLKYSQMQHMVGDTLADDPFLGLPNASIFDPATEAFTDVPPSAHGRWYPTTLELNDGRILTFSGLDENGNTNQSLEIYTANGNSATKSDEYVSPWAPPLYPRMHLLPSGRSFIPLRLLIRTCSTPPRTVGSAIPGWRVLPARRRAPWPGPFTVGETKSAPTVPRCCCP
jgi:hypothetical protein